MGRCRILDRLQIEVMYELPFRGSYYYVRHQHKKSRDPGTKCHVRTMMHNEDCETYKMNTHHVSFHQSVEEIRPGKV